MSKDRPNGRAGVIDQVSTVPPLFVGVTDVMAVPFVKVNGVPLYTIE